MVVREQVIDYRLIFPRFIQRTSLYKSSLGFEIRPKIFAMYIRAERLQRRSFTPEPCLQQAYVS